VCTGQQRSSSRNLFHIMLFPLFASTRIVSFSYHIGSRDLAMNIDRDCTEGVLASGEALLKATPSAL
jgi:hypothetical protein